MNVFKSSLHHSLPQYFFVGVLFIIMWYIAGWSTDNWDWIPYERYFSYGDEISLSTTLDISFVYLNQFLSNKGLDFLQYRQLIYFIYLLFVSIIILKYSSKPILVSLVYFAVLFFRDVIVTRNALALLFLTIAVFNLMSKESKNKKTKFLIFWLLSCSFHISFLIYGFLLLSDKKIRFTPLLIGVLTLAFFGHFLLSNIINLDFLLGLSKLQVKAEGYLSGGSYISLFVSSFTMIFTYIVAKRIVGDCENNTSCFDGEIFQNMIKLLFPILIFCSINMEFMRLFYNFFLISFIVMLEIRYRDFDNNASKNLLLTLWVIYSFIWIVPMSGVGPQVVLILNSIK